jgi:lipopolysaccharide biosynthesis protein
MLQVELLKHFSNYSYQINLIMIPKQAIKSLARLLYLLAISPFITLKNLLFFRKYSVYSCLDGAVDPLLMNKICVFCHYDKKGRVADYVIHYLKELHNLGFAIFFVSNSGSLNQSEADRVLPSVSKILLRFNEGYDFGAYYAGMQEVQKFTHHDLLLLANDSVYGPLVPLDKVIELASGNKADVVSITDSYAINYHLQSYFLLLNKKAFNSTEFKLFWQRFKFTGNKTYVVYNYEIGLSQALIKAGLQLKSLCSYTEVSSFYFSKKNNDKNLCENYPYDQSIVFWQELIEQFGCPFIKKKLIPEGTNTFDRDDYMNIVSKTGYDVKLVKQ